MFPVHMNYGWDQTTFLLSPVLGSGCNRAELAVLPHIAQNHTVLTKALQHLCGRGQMGQHYCFCTPWAYCRLMGCLVVSARCHLKCSLSFYLFPFVLPLFKVSILLIVPVFRFRFCLLFLDFLALQFGLLSRSLQQCNKLLKCKSLLLSCFFNW